MIKTNHELVAAAKNIAENKKTLYVLGCFGAPMNASNKARYTSNLAFNAKSARKAKINAASSDTFGFDCVCLIKGLLWGWAGDASKQYGGSTYASNNVPDISANQLIEVCRDVSKDFSEIMPGEVVWISGHVGLYIGNGLVVECTYRWNDGVQITAAHNIGTKSGYNGRSWTKHGKLPYVEYSVETVQKPTETPTEPEQITLDQAVEVLAKAVIDGTFGNGAERKEKLYQAVQNKVNELCK